MSSSGVSARRAPATRRVILVACVMVCGGWSWLRSQDAEVQRGNELYEQGDFAGALTQYRSALTRGEAPGIHYDIGTALYRLSETASGERKQELIEKAQESLGKAVASGGRSKLTSDAHHNLGNIAADQGDYAAAVREYKKALRADSSNDAARYNLELAQRKLNKNKPRPRRGQGQPKQGGGQGQPKQGGGQGQPKQGGGQGQPNQPPQQGGGQGQPNQSPKQGGGQGQPNQSPKQGGGQGQPNQPPQQGGGQGQPNQSPKQGGGQGQPRQPSRDQTAPKPGTNNHNQPGQGNPRRDGASGDGAASGKPKSETDRKLEALERQSQRLRRKRYRGLPRRGTGRARPTKDW